ncbi:hypothetical protein BJ878DRAFT_572240 [Calycina marina]|uniref:F-box domain-containing protein n=1 Tax=Calycina marina TaxID=1763456 RepID=A0A9P7ZAX0_9HELO|nr:hypothetical protein BJ878DRAFT_572240 [Calycina marina]
MDQSNTARDFSAMPPEILIEIFSHLPQTDFLALTCTNKLFRETITNNAATICNRAIQNNAVYSRIAKRFDAQLVNGWLVPQTPIVATMEDRWCELGTFCQRCYRNQYGRSLSESGIDPCVLLSSPGPQFLLAVDKVISRFEARIVESYEKHGQEAPSMTEGQRLVRSVCSKNLPWLLESIHCATAEPHRMWKEGHSWKSGELKDMAWYYKQDRKPRF